jgi:hypothetical protein
MSDRYSITIPPEAELAASKLKDKAGLLRAIARELDRQNLYTVAHIQSAYMSFPKSGPTTLKGTRVISNRLRNSLRATKAVVAGNGLESTIGTNVVYAAALEYGFDGEETVSPHMRQSFSRQRVFGRRKKIRGADIAVRGYTRQMHLPARLMIHKGIEDRLPEYGPALGDAITQFATSHD